MQIFAWTKFHAHIDDEFHAEVAQDVVFIGRGSGADKKICGDGGKVHVNNRNIFFIDQFRVFFPANVLPFSIENDRRVRVRRATFE